MVYGKLNVRWNPMEGERGSGGDIGTQLSLGSQTWPNVWNDTEMAQGTVDRISYFLHAVTSLETFFLWLNVQDHFYYVFTKELLGATVGWAQSRPAQVRGSSVQLLRYRHMFIHVALEETGVGKKI